MGTLSPQNRNEKQMELVALPQPATSEKLTTADATTLQISTVKYGVGGACVRREAIGKAGLVCHVRARGRSVVHIQSNITKGNAFSMHFQGRHWPGR